MQVWHISVVQFLSTCRVIDITGFYTAKLQQVTQLLGSLEKDLKESTLTTQRKSRKRRRCINVLLLTSGSCPERVNTLLELRQHGTSPKDADPIYCKDVSSIWYAL